MSIFTNGCNSENDKPKILKFEGNTPKILQGSSYVFDSSSLSLRYWYKSIIDYNTLSKTLLPSENLEVLFNFTTIFVLSIPPNTTTYTSLEIIVDLYKVGSTQPDISVNLNDTLLLNFNEEFEKCVITNNSTGLTEGHSINVLLTI